MKLMLCFKVFCPQTNLNLYTNNKSKVNFLSTYLKNKLASGWKICRYEGIEQDIQITKQHCLQTSIYPTQ